MAQDLPLSSATVAPRTGKSRPIYVELASLGKPLLKVTGVFAVIGLILAVVRFPYQTDEIGERHIARPTDYSQFYQRIYKAPDPSAQVEEQDEAYVRIAKQAIEDAQVVPRVRRFVESYGLGNAHVLDVGSGTGYLQDVVQDYVGLDISPTASRYYHKPFVEASATEMPFPDNEFDALWSIWVLEHVPTPEQALSEIRRVAKDGALLFLDPAWHCSAWAADGYPVRPFSDFDLKGKLAKLGYIGGEFPPIPHFEQSFVRAALLARRISGGPTRLHYRPLQANYDHYWMPDSDAINSLDRYEVSLWFTSRGDECLNCGDRFLNATQELVIRVHKR